jgi:hypothetical protein
MKPHDLFRAKYQLDHPDNYLRIDLVATGLKLLEEVQRLRAAVKRLPKSKQNEINQEQDEP